MPAPRRPNHPEMRSISEGFEPAPSVKSVPPIDSVPTQAFASAALDAANT